MKLIQAVLGIFLLLRPYQWYKNIPIFCFIFYSGQFLNDNLLMLTLIGFLLLCMISSSIYALNDVIDAKKDKDHPEKSKRPVASGKINSKSALGISIILLAIGLYTSSIFSLHLMMLLFVLYLNGFIYSYFLKKFLILGSVIVSFNFLIRAISGLIIINSVSALKSNFVFILISIYFLAFLLLYLKRSSNKDFEINYYFPIFAIFLIVCSYSIFVLIEKNNFLILTIPVGAFILIYHLYCVKTNDKLSRNPHKIFQNKIQLLMIVIFMLVSYASVYL